MTYSESDLIIPVLLLLADAGSHGLTTTEIKEALLGELDLSEDDLKILAGRNDSHFSQQVRNLVSHRTLVNKGVATYEPGSQSGRFWITELGRSYSAEHLGDFEFLITSGFTDEQRKTVIDADFDNFIIEEGHFIPATQVQKRKRSRKLTEKARQYYARDGKLYCAGCNFSFDNFYGKTARGYIEIHHLKPIHTYERSDVERQLKDALGNVRPLCANCHRMAHRNTKNLLDDKQLRQLVVTHGEFDIPTE